MTTFKLFAVLFLSFLMTLGGISMPIDSSENSLVTIFLNPGLEAFEDGDVTRIENLLSDFPFNKSESDSIGIRLGFCLASLYSGLGKMEEALAVLEKSIVKVNGRFMDVGIALHLQKAFIHFRYNRYELSINELNEALRIEGNLNGELTLKAAELHNNLSVVCANAAQYEEEIRHLEIAKQILEENDLTQDFRMSTVLNNLGVRYNRMGQFGRALEAYKATITIRENNKDGGKFDIGRGYYHLGMIYYDMNELSLAEVQIKKALSLHQAVGDSALYEIHSDYNVLGMIYRAQGKINRAIKYQQLAKETAAKSPENLQTDVARSLGNLGVLHGQKQDTLAEITAYRKAQHLFSLYDPSHVHNSWYLRNICAYYLEYSQPKKAEKSLEKLHVFEKLYLVSDTINLNKNKLLYAQFYYENGDYEEAIKLLETIINQSSLARNASTIGSSSETELDALNWILKSYLAWQDDSPKAIGIADLLPFLEKSASLVHQTQSQSLSFESKYKLVGDRQDLLDLCMESYFRGYNTTQNVAYIEAGLNLMEARKALKLRQNLINKQRVTKNWLPDSIRAKENEIRTSLSFYQDKLGLISAENNENYNRISKKISELFQALETHLEEVKRLFPGYYELVKKPEIINLVSLEERIGESSFFLALHTSAEFIYKIVYNGEKWDFVRTNKENSFTEDVNQFLAAISQLPNPARPVDINPIRDKIAKPILDQITWKIGIKQFIINPSSELYSIPFDLLVKGDYVYFENLTTNYVFSLYQWINSEKKEIRKPSILAVSPSRGFEDLPHLAEELSFLKSLFGSKFFNFLDLDKSKPSSLERYDLIHIASHAEVNDSLPSMTAIQLDFDRKLTLGDLYLLNLKARSVFLAAWNSAIGSSQAGEGLLSLAYGFLYAGCPSVVMNLWNADDQSSAKISEFYYSNLAEGMDQGKALSEAKKKFLAQADVLHQHPYYWAGIIHSGQLEVLMPPTMNWTKVGVGLVVLFGLLTVYRIFKRNKRRV